MVSISPWHFLHSTGKIFQTLVVWLQFQSWSRKAKYSSFPHTRNWNSFLGVGEAKWRTDECKGPEAGSYLEPDLFEDLRLRT